MTKGFLTIAAVLALVLLFAAAVEPNAETREAVAAVFDAGETVTDAKILFFYAPALVSSEWHESQTYVCTIGGHRFFA